MSLSSASARCREARNDPLSEKLTSKGAIKVRCADCYGSRCTDDRCPLYGLAKPHIGADRYAAIRRYCGCCMNGLPVRQCSCAGFAPFAGTAAQPTVSLKINF